MTALVLRRDTAGALYVAAALACLVPATQEHGSKLGAANVAIGAMLSAVALLPVNCLDYIESTLSALQKDFTIRHFPLGQQCSRCVSRGPSRPRPAAGCRGHCHQSAVP